MKKERFLTLITFFVFLFLSNNVHALDFFSIDMEADELVKINSSTGEITVVGSLGYDVQFDIDLATIDGKLYGLQYNYGVETNLLEIDPCSGAVISSQRVTLNNATPMIAEGLANYNGELFIAYNTITHAWSQYLGKLSLTGEITNSILPSPTTDSDALCANSNFLYNFDGHAPYNYTKFSSINPSTGTVTAIASYPIVAGGSDDCVIVDNSLYSINHYSNKIQRTNINDGTFEDLVSINNVYRGLALIEENTIFADWHQIDNVNELALGSIGSVNVTFSGTDLAGGDTDGTSTRFNASYFTPPLTNSDVIYLLSFHPAYNYNIRFSKPLKNPIIHLQSFASTLTFPGITLEKVSGEDTFIVSGSTVSGVLNDNPTGHDANGTVMLQGTFTSIDFSAYYDLGPTPDGIAMQIGGTPVIQEIESFTGTDTTINPLPLAGQGADISATVSDTCSPVQWNLTVDNRPVQQGLGSDVQAKWDGRNKDGKIVPGIYDVVLTSSTIDNIMTATQTMQAEVDWNDNCELDVKFSTPCDDQVEVPENCVGGCFNGHNYAICQGRLNIWEASTACTADLGWNLAYIDNEEENSWVVDTALEAFGCGDILNTSYWVSNIKAETGTHWPSEIPIWANGEPSGDGNHVHLIRFCNQPYGWNDVPWTWAWGWVCESGTE